MGRVGGRTTAGRTVSLHSLDVVSVDTEGSRSQLMSNTDLLQLSGQEAASGRGKDDLPFIDSIFGGRGGGALEGFGKGGGQVN